MAKPFSCSIGATAAAEMQVLNAHRVPIIAWWPPIGGQNSAGQWAAAPVIQVKHRPDIADLARLIHQEPTGDGDNWSQWSFVMDPTPRLALADCKQITPAACRFVLSFSIDKHRTLLEWIATTGCMAITTKPPVRKADGRIEGSIIFFQTPTDDLRTMLAMVRLQERVN